MTGAPPTDQTTRFSMGPALLFCPGDRPDRFTKAAERADAVILDLEDAVGAENKAAARAAIREHPLDAERTIVRINATDSEWFDDDVAAVRETGYRTVMVPKCSSAEPLEMLSDFSLVALCETAAGIIAAPAIAAAPNVVALMWGAEDLIASLGGTSSRDSAGRYRAVAQHARSAVLLAAGAYGRAAIDSVYLDIPDLDALEHQSRDAVASGFDAVACIHPTQVTTVRRAFEPDAAAVESARALLAAAEGELGVFRYRGMMVDEPLLSQARRVLDRTGSTAFSS